MKAYKKKRNIFLLLSILWFILIIFFSSQTADISSELSGGITEKVIITLEKMNLVEEGSSMDPNFLNSFHSIIRKLAHMFEYFILAIFLSNYFYYSGNNRKQIVIFSLIFTVLAAGTDELFQTTIDGRSGQVSDVLIDIFGGLIGLFMVNMSKGFKELKREESLNDKNY